jgi:hypothetical protein
MHMPKRFLCPSLGAGTTAALALLLAAAPAAAQSGPPQAQAQYVGVYARVVGDRHAPLQERIRCARLLGQLGPKAKSAAPVLLQTLKHRGPLWGKVKRVTPVDPTDPYSQPIPYTVYVFMGPDLRYAALRALLKINPESDRLVAALAEGLEDLHQIYSAHTAEPTPYNPAISQEDKEYIEEDVRRDIEEGPEYLERKEKEVTAKLNGLAIEASKVLAGYGPKARQAVPVLIQIATRELGSPKKDPDDHILLPTGGPEKGGGSGATKAKWITPNCRLAAIEALGAIASAKDSAAVEALRTIAALDTDQALRRAAAQAVAQIRERQDP